ncbi:nucleotide-binding universal stress UspA family protein [Kibdelosporangium banguiense]|uniref:Nucleotide-binding universal stress UspA family protein n=1 Tax=Kibdelosporangium banguiense TaxID=1365924 RepID=A0ABS4TWM1_9PSEU|nr:universal stress protein [Kibdelosporangium banguiense]MBP2328797.1 nucleotide-binding universal stress UspA family protein [Kibdelosporangium banguiense]
MTTRTAPAIQPVPQQRQLRRPRIAVGTDGTLWGDAALDWALRHAGPLNAQVRVFAAESSDDQAIARRLSAYRWLFTSVSVSPEPPVQTLVAASKDHDLLVLGYRGRQHGPFGLGRSVVPIVTAARCDTVVVRGQTRAVQGEHRWITAAISGQDDTLVVRRAVQFAIRSRSRLRLLHAAPLPGAPAVPAVVAPASILEHAHDLVHELAPDLTPSLRLVRSQPHEAVRTCDRTDLLVIGSGNQPGKLSVITSTALHMATCPVLVVKPQ